MLIQTAVVGSAAIGATLIIITGGLDLSVGSTIALVTMVVALLLEAGTPPLVAALGGVGAGAACGSAIGLMIIGRIHIVIALAGALLAFLWMRTALHPAAAALLGALVGAVAIWGGGRLVGRLPLSPFIVTLGAWGALRGVAKGLGDNQPVYPAQTQWLSQWMTGADAGLFHHVPAALFILAVLALLMGGVLGYTRLGRHACAVGSSEETARLCGVAVDRTKLVVYALGVACAGVAGVLQFSYLTMGDPTTASGYELRVIAAAVIGGASLSGGEGTIRGTLIGALLMTVVDNGCTKLGLENWIQEIVTGAIIVAAVVVDRSRRV